MREYLDLDYHANVVSMLRPDVEGAMWLVDDCDEVAFYDRVCHEQGRVFDEDGFALRVFELLRRRGLEGVVAAARNTQYEGDFPEGVFQLDLGDVASAVLASPHAVGVLRSVLGTAWVKACERKIGCPRRRAAQVARCSSAVCSWRRRSGREDGRREGFWKKVVRWEDFEIRWGYLTTEARRSGVSPSEVEQVRTEIAEWGLEELLAHSDGFHAICALAGAGAHYKPRGVSAQRKVDAHSLLTTLVTGYQLDTIESQRVFARMLVWAWRYPDYPLFRDWRSRDAFGVLWDQRYWENDLAALLGAMGPEDDLCAFKLDLDYFGRINKEAGSQVGDEGLRLYLKIVQGVLHRAGPVYRRGGDEVVALALGLGRSKAIDLAEEVRRTIEAEFSEWGRRLNLSTYPTVSIGVATVGAGASLDEVAKLMDRAQLKAKEDGRNRVVVAP
jgi:diguanylate cyclase (GGDEF)-like protein